jgi:hypothetical protein
MQHNLILDWFAFNWLGHAMRTVRWLYPLCQIVHFIGLCFLIGAILLVDLRLMGFLRRVSPRAVLSAIPVAVVAFAVNALTGLAFFASDPYRFWFDGAFRYKMAAIALAGVNAIWFTLIEQPKLLKAPQDAPSSAATRICAGLSLGLWLAVIVCGRLLPVFQP